MTKEESLILNATQIDQKIKRMAYEIYEQNFKEKRIYLAGVKPQGLILAKALGKWLDEISKMNVEIVEIDLDKSEPAKSEIKMSIEPEDFSGKVIVLVDDVLNTGKTFAYSLRPLLSQNLKKIEVAVLVNRCHSNFPIHSNYTGYELSTTITEHVNVVLKGKDKGVYLV